MDTQTSWERRGHTRKPNAVVRGIYWLADWLSDFGHLANQTKRGAGHVSSFAGYSLLLIVTFVITISIIVTSAIHSIELLHYIGFSDWMAYPILFAVEAIFLTGSIQIDLSLKHGLPLFGRFFKPSPPILGFVAGLAFVLPSNIYGLADNWGGLIFGLATPFLLIIAKSMLAWQYGFKSKVATRIATNNEQKVIEKTPSAEQNSEQKNDRNIEKKSVVENEVEGLELQRLSDVAATKKETDEVSEIEQKNVATAQEKQTQKRKSTTTKTNKKRYRKMQVAYEELKQELGKAPGRNRLSKRAGVSVTEAQRFLDELKKQTELQLDKPLEEQPALRRVK
jgi:hypothetical protein